MLPLLIALALISVAALAAAVSALANPREPEQEQPARVSEPSAFLMNAEGDSAARIQHVNHDLLVARLEQYVRRERAAVESFHEQPNPALLQSHSQPWVN